jgi:hypothetical protein
MSLVYFRSDEVSDTSQYTQAVGDHLLYVAASIWLLPPTPRLLASPSIGGSSLRVSPRLVNPVCCYVPLLSDPGRSFMELEVGGGTTQ